jgi:DNA-directed RNA polymerase subunit M/transcription elongation factor TFIIS
MGKKAENTGFVCENCGGEVLPVKTGYRNHCPRCLHSKHVDNEPGDRRSECGGLMAPKSAKLTSGKGIQILHKCKACGFTRYNMAAEDDDYDLLLELTFK